MKYHQRLRDIREDLDLEQKDIAELLQTTQQQISKYETGKHEIPFSRVITLARYYNVSLDYIAGITDMPATINGKPLQIIKRNSDNINISTNGNGNTINIKK